MENEDSDLVENIQAISDTTYALEVSILNPYSFTTDALLFSVPLDDNYVEDGLLRKANSNTGD